MYIILVLNIDVSIHSKTGPLVKKKYWLCERQGCENKYLHELLAPNSFFSGNTV